IYPIGAGTSQVNNAGILKKSAGTGTSCLGSNITVLNQMGTVEGDTGTFQLPAMASNSGSYVIAPRANLKPFQGGTFNVFQFSGTGTLALQGTTVLNGDWTTFPAILSLGAGNTTFNGKASFTGTTAIAGAVTFNDVTNLGTVNLTGTLSGTGAV